MTLHLSPLQLLSLAAYFAGAYLSDHVAGAAVVGLAVWVNFRLYRRVFG